jgi:hypothetical protein
MNDLKQDLAAIAAALPGLPGTVDGLHQEARDLGDAVADLAADLGAARGELDGALSALAARLDAWRVQVEGFGEQLAEAGRPAESSWTTARDGLQESAGRIDAGAETLEDERVAQLHEAEESLSRVRRAWDGAAAAERLRAEGREGVDKVEAGVEASRQQAEALRATVEEALDTSGDAAAALDKHLDDAAAGARGRAVFFAGEMLLRHLGDHRENLQSIADAVGAHAAALREEAETALSAVLAPLAAATAGTVEAMASFTAEDALTSRAGAEAVSLEDQRDKLQGTLQLLTGEAENLPAVMHEVEISAQLTGLP